MSCAVQNATLGALSSRSALSVLVGALFKKFGLFLNTPRTQLHILLIYSIAEPEDEPQHAAAVFKKNRRVW
jgi:hypothetical protein